MTFLVNNIPIFNWFEVSFRLKFTKGNSKAKETFFVCPILKTFLIFITAFVCLTSNAQNYKPFTIRYNNELKGNMLLIGNNILGKDNNALSDNSVNQSTNMQYIDIDSDATTFSSSSANLKMPATTSCFKIAYAGLYWGAILQVPQSRTDINKIKLKLPGNTTYTDITGELIYDAVVAPIAAGTNEPTNTPYACYADVTTLVSALANPQGTFTVANVTSSLGFNSSTGLSAGWTLFVVYEDTNATTKSITTFDGFSSIYDDKTLSIPISGFRTPPSGVIDILYAFASLEGDKGEIGSKTEINGKAIVTPQRASNKFFNSAITDAGGYFTDRVPSSSNTLGYDTGIESVLGAEKSVINHNATSATITVQVAKGQADPVFSFFNAFAVDVIAPDIALTKTVEDASGNDASNANVTLGQNLYYEINYQNIGNDNVANFTIKDILPENIIFNYPGDIDLTNSGGATVQSYDPLSRTIIFSIPNTSVEISDPKYTIRIKVQVVPTCNELSNACSNEIKNQAFATYRGIVNTTQITDDASFSTTICNFGTAQPTNFLVGITNCTFQRTEVLCGASVVLSAADGYASYSWSTSPTGTPVIGTSQTYTATQTGVYYARNTASGTCLSIDEQITVVPYGNTITNPVIPFADLLPICPNNGKVLPNIFLCGANATRSITTGISDAASIVWQKLDESSCAAVTVDNCANESSACTWNQVGTGPDYTANSAGQYRITINYVGGCYSVFYFNVYQNLLNPTVTSQDIICNTLGQITVGGVPGGYEYSLNAAGPYQSSNVFSITTPNSYTVYIKQVGVVTNPCVFTVPDILIRNRDFTVSKFVTQPLCNGDQGVIKLAANDVLPQYYFSIHQGATLVNSAGPLMANDYEFSGLNPGIYTARVWTDDGCDYSEDIEIINPPLLTATSALSKPLTCTDGEITVYPVGGTPPYTYFINGTSNFQSIPQIAVTNPLPAGGIYTIIVEDSKGCSATTIITVAAMPPPVYTVSQTDVKCYNDTTGAINFNVTNANGYTLAYSIDNGTTYVANPSFSNLSAGTYNAIVKYSLAGTDCFSTAQTITITQPTTALTASAGVSELAGCGPSGEGKIRITNPQGGTAPYEYSFDNQVTWTTVNEAYIAPGTYTVYIRDANGCIFAMPNITIDPVPVEPTITVADAVFNCDGTATSTVTVTNNGGVNFSYEYLLDGAANTNVPSNVFTNVPSGTHTISVSYKLLTVPTYSNLLKEDFGSGSDVSSPGINTAFCWEKQDFTTCNNDGKLGNGEYTVTKHLENNPYNGWHNPVDHTSGSAIGRYLAVDAGSAIPNNAVLYRKTINDIIPNQPIQVTFYATNLLKVGNTQPNASLTVELQNSSETPLSSSSTGGIPKTDGWVRYDRTIDPGNNTTLDFVLRLEVAQVNGIDFAVDDIEVYQLPKACVTTKDFTVIIPTDEAFTAAVTGFKNITCAGTNNGEITIAAQNFDPTNGFQYSIDNGVNWFTQMTSPHTISGLADGTYNVQIRYDAISTGTCVQSFTQILTAPVPLVTTAAVTSLATCTIGGTITASSAGGTTAYRYELWNATGTVNVQPSQNTGIFTNVAPGAYIVRGYDANNCTDDTAVLTVVTPPTLTATLDPSSDLCFDSANKASLVVNASGGTSPYVYSLDGAPSQNSNTFSNVGVGTHTIVVTDSFGCTATISNITIAPQLTAAITNIRELDCTASPNAVITGTITGGNAPFVVTVLSGTGPGILAQPTATTFTYTTAVASSYQFQIQDAQGCVATATATINPLVPVTATTTNVNPGCNGAADGSVQITPSGGVGPYTYSFNGSSFTSTSLYSGLSAGIAYAYEVRDSKNCPFTGTVTLTQPTALVASATATAFSCSAANTKQSATITIAVPTTGTAPYQYSFNGGGYTNTNTLAVNDNGTDQTIPYSVRDANGCTDGGSVTLLKLNPPIAGTIGTTAVTCIVTTSTVTVTPSAGTGVGTLTYEITFPLASATSNTTGVFTGLLPGTYIFKVTDTNGCYYTQSHNVLPVTPIAVSGNVTSDVLCKGGNTGSATFTVSGYSGTYTSSLTNGTGTLVQTGNTVNLTNLIAGNYTLQVTDNATGCTANASVTITEPTAALTFTANATNVNCNNDNSQITVAVSGGTLNYTYAAVIAGAAAPTTYSNSNIIIVDTNSGANLSWDVYVKDANGCVTNNTLLPTIVMLDPMPTVTTTLLPTDQCTSSGSSYSFTATGTGVAPLTYSIGGSFQASPTFTVTATGLYTITIKDGNGCTATTTITVYPVLTTAAVLTADLDCIAPTDATIRIDAAGGKAPYSYLVSVNGGAYGSAGISGNVFTTNSAGTFLFEVTDANGCKKVSNPITINPKEDPVITLLDPTQEIYCNGEATASITVNIDASKGIGPFTYSLDGTTFQASNVFSGLVAGTYTVTVKDSKGCTDTETIIIDQPDALDYTLTKTDILCATMTLGSISIDVSSGLGGTAPYTYILTNNAGYTTQTVNYATATDHTFNNLDFGTYYLTVVDANGCSLKTTAKVASPPDNLNILVEPTADCASGGTVKVTATGALLGTGPFYFAIYQKDPVTGLYPMAPSFLPGVQPPFQAEDALGSRSTTFTGLLQGVIYSFIVYDQSTGCSYIKEASTPTIKATSLATLRVVTDVTCKGANDGTVSITLDKDPSAAPGYSPPTSIDYEVYDSKTNMPLSPVPNDGYGITVGTYPFVMPLIGGLAPGSYYVVITEHNGTNDGCSSATLPFDIYESATDLTLTASVVKNDNCSLEAGQIVAIAQGGTTVSRDDPLAVPPQVSAPVPYQYQILPDTGTIGDASDDVPPTASDSNWATDNFFEKDSGNYIVYAMDANKCIKSFPITLSLDPSPAITLAVVDQCAVEGAFEIVVNEATAGVAPYSISVNGSAYQNFSFVPGTPNSYTISNLNSGTYNISVQDVNGCIDTESITLYKKVSASSILNKEWTCTTGNSDALITTTIFDGQGVFSYKVNINGGGYGLPTNVVGNSFTYSPAPLATATTYQFEITDANGCLVETNVITIEPIENPTATTIVANATCSGTSNGSVTIIPSLGVPPYTYDFNGSGFTANATYGGLAGSVAGTAYNYQVKDSYDCIFIGTATVFEPTPVAGTIDLTQGLTCGAGNATQAATVTVTATPGTGTAPYYYSFNGGLSYSSNNVYTTNVAGNVNALIKDGNGCVIAAALTVPVPALVPPTDLTFSTTFPVTCLAPGTIEITGVTGGVGTLQYETIAPSPIIIAKQTTTTFASLTPGTYLFQVTDANGCTYQESYTVNPVTNITVSGQLMSNVTCNPGANGEVRFTVANFAGNYSYSLDGGTTVFTGQTNPTVTVSGLTSASTQTITVTDEATGCTATTSINVAQPAPLALVANPFINANCNFGAQVSVTVSGGVAPYSYSYVPSGNPAGTYSNSANAVLDPAMATSWDVYVRDANGCVITTPLAITIATDPLPSVTVNPYSQCPSATGTYNFTVAATGMAPFEYSIGAGFQASPTFTVNAAGTYDVTVKDKNGCTTTVPALVNILPVLQLQAAITALPSCTDGDGALTLTATGGSGTYEYSLDTGTYQPSANFATIAAGSHTVTVRDITTNCTKSIPVNLGAATPITGFALSKTDVSCNGGSNGVITATMTTPAPGVNDNPVYNYSLSGTAIRPDQVSNVFSGLTAGNYTVTVTSARGCVATQNITVVEPAIITVPAPTVSQFGCNSGSNAMNFATITVTGVTGGSGIYNYEFIKGGTVVQFGTTNIYTESNLLGGTYTVNVYDSKGCIGIAPATITIVPFIALDKVTVNVDRAITCTNPEDITVIVSSIGGTPASLQYTVADSNATTGVIGANYNFTNTTGIFTGLNVGNYLITVVNPATGCSVKSVHYVNEPNTFDLTINSVTDVSCFGGTNGSVNVILIDRVITATNPNQAGAFSYTIVDALGNPVTSGTSATAGPLTISALAAGTYTITATLTNSPFCTVSKNFTINQPNAALTIAETHTAITCISGNNDGSISATATGGWPGGYQFELTGPVTVAYSAQRTFTNLTAGTYTVNVRDSKGCVATTTVILVIPTPITVTASSDTTMLSCFGDKTATITVNLPSGGQGSNYKYTLNTTSLTPATASGPQASPVFSGLGAGTYTITVTDGYSCSATTAPIVIAQPTRVSASLVVAATQTCLTQTRLTLSATGGMGTYTYSTDAAFTTVLGSFATSTTFPVPVGTYVYYVKDANGCISNVSNQIKIDPLPALIINLDRTNAVINCAGDNTGVIVATAQGGLGNYSYTLLNGLGATVQGPTASGNFTGLFAGNYQVKVDSGDCATLSAMISITQPLAPLTATYVTQEVSCNGANNGVFTVNASGGTGIIKYAISPNLNQFLDTNIFDKLAPGNYDVIVQDVLGCYVKINFDITEPAPIVASTIPGTIIPEICFGDKDAAFMIEVTGGVLPYSVSLDNPTGTYTSGAPTQTQFDFTGLTGGSHTVYIRDANGCSVEWVVALPESVKINPMAVVDYSCVNNAANNTVTVTVDASITNPADLDYSLDGAAYQTSNVFTNVVPGTNHYIDVRHTNGCIQRTANFEILQVDPLTLALNDGGLNEIVATATGGGGGYQYTFNGESNGTKNTFIIYKSGDYTVEVTDANGCVASATRYFEYIDVCIPNYFTPNGDGISDGWAPGCTVNYKDLTFDIFDRYGRKIATYRLGEYWNGKYNGQELPSGDYWYVLRLNDPKDNREFVGHFTLYR